MGSTISKILLPGIISDKLLGRDKKKAAPAAAAPVAAAKPKKTGVGPTGPDKAELKAERAQKARRGLLGRGAEDREMVPGARDVLGARADSLGVPSSAEIQGNRRFKREGVKGASRRLLS